MNEDRRIYAVQSALQHRLIVAEERDRRDDHDLSWDRSWIKSELARLSIAEVSDSEIDLALQLLRESAAARKS